MSFQTTVQLHGKTATGLSVPAEVVESLGSGKRVPVRVTLNGYMYRSTVAVYGGEYMLPLSAENRNGAGVSAGDVITVALEVDREPREVEVPADLQAALDADPRVAEAFAKLSYSHKREHVMAVEGAKAQETRQRRIEKAVAMLREAKK